MVGEAAVHVRQGEHSDVSGCVSVIVCVCVCVCVRAYVRAGVCVCVEWRGYL